MRTWTDTDGDTWYNVEHDQWTMYNPADPDDRQPASVSNVTQARMREHFPSFPY